MWKSPTRSKKTTSEPGDARAWHESARHAESALPFRRISFAMLGVILLRWGVAPPPAATPGALSAMSKWAPTSALAREAGGHSRRRRIATRSKRVAGTAGPRARHCRSSAGQVARRRDSLSTSTHLLICYTVKHRVSFSLNQYSQTSSFFRDNGPMPAVATLSSMGSTARWPPASLRVRPSWPRSCGVNGAVCSGSMQCSRRMSMTRRPRRRSGAGCHRGLRPTTNGPASRRSGA